MRDELKDRAGRLISFPSEGKDELRTPQRANTKDDTHLQRNEESRDLLNQHVCVCVSAAQVAL